MSNRKMIMQPVKYSITTLGGGQTQAGVSYPGGLDLVTPSLRLQPGAVRDGVNFECMQSGGYGRIMGYERYDGQAAPSDATYLIIQFTAFLNTPLVGQTATQDVTGATGTIFEVVQGTTPATGAYLGDPEGGFVGDPEGGFVGDPEGMAGVGYAYIAVTQITGNFDTTHMVSSLAGSIGIPIPTTFVLDPETDAQYQAAAADVYRAIIGAVPGSGKVLGVVHMVFAGVSNVYAFRATVDGTAIAIYKASTSGWVLVPYLNLLNWTTGVTMPLDGDVLTQGGVTATINRVMWQAGAFAPPLWVHSTAYALNATASNGPNIYVVTTAGTSAGSGGPTGTGTGITDGSVVWAWLGPITAVGAFVVTNPAGGNFTAGLATTSSGGVITLSGAQTPITMTVGINATTGLGNRFEFVKCNFSGQLVTHRIYGCDGVNPPFEFDGTTLAPIDTGLSPNAPDHIYFHKNFLFIAQDSSLIYCGVGTPFKWTAIDGGGEIATGDQVTGMLTLPGSQTTATLGVYLKSNTAFLYGTDPSTFNFVTFNTGLGALQYSAQNLFDTFVLDTLGVVTLRTTLNWGNFLPTTLTKNMLPFIIQERNKLTASCIFREKSSYRLFFSDGYGLWLTMMNQQYLGSLPVLFPNPVYVVDQDVNTDEEEVLFFGSNDAQGYVYQMERGTSFDGAPINAYIDMAWDFIKSPRILKRFRAASTEVQGDGFATFDFGYQLGWASPEVAQPPLLNEQSSFAVAPIWDQVTWDQFTWDGATQSLSPNDVNMTGTAENVRVIVSTSTNYVSAFTLNSVIYHYSLGRGIRV